MMITRAEVNETSFGRAVGHQHRVPHACAVSCRCHCPIAPTAPNTELRSTDRVAIHATTLNDRTSNQ